MDWLATPSAVRALILAQQEENQDLRARVSAMATELASLRERIGRTSRHSSKPQGFRTAVTTLQQWSWV